MFSPVSVFQHPLPQIRNQKKKPTMEKQQQNQTPSFLKLYTGDSDDKLRIPDSFMNQYGQNLSSKIALTSTYGDPVVVSVEMIGSRGRRKCFYFTLGWADFIEENGVDEGDSMIFNFTGDKTANVVVYDASGCVKSLKVKKQQVGSFTPKKRCRNEDDEETEHASVPRKAGKRVKRVNKVKPELHSSAKAHGSAKLASFSVDYKEYNKYFLNIPREISNTIELSAGDKVQLQDPNGEVWSVEIKAVDRRPRHLRLCGGWHDFVKGNGVVVGDRLEFCYEAELGLIRVKIDRKKMVKIDDRKKKKVMASQVKIEEEEEDGDGLYCERVVVLSD